MRQLKSLSLIIRLEYFSVQLNHGALVNHVVVAHTCFPDLVELDVY